jgi:hypothetical protein
VIRGLDARILVAGGLHGAVHARRATAAFAWQRSSRSKLVGTAPCASNRKRNEP